MALLAALTVVASIGRWFPEISELAHPLCRPQQPFKPRLIGRRVNDGVLNSPESAACLSLDPIERSRKCAGASAGESSGRGPRCRNQLVNLSGGEVFSVGRSLF